MRSADRAATSVFARIARFFNWVGDSNPLDQYKLKIDQATEQIHDAHNKLPPLRAHLTRLDRELTTAKEQVTLYNARVDQALKASEAAKVKNNAAEVAEYDALAAKNDGLLQTAESQVAGLVKQKDTFQKQYDAVVQRIKDSEEVIIAETEECRRLGNNLEISEATKAATQIATSLSGVGSTNPLSDVQEIKNKVQQKIDENMAVSDVATDLGEDNSAAKKEEITMQQINTEDRLAKRKAAMAAQAAATVTPTPAPAATPAA